MANAFFGLFLFAVPISASFSSSSTASLTSIEKGDQEFARINYPVAEAIYTSVLTAPADSVNALWRLARLYVCMADVSQPNQKLDLYRQAEAFASRCISADSMKSEGHTWRAAALGNIATYGEGKTRASDERTQLSAAGFIEGINE